MNFPNSDLPQRLELLDEVTPIQRLLRLEAALGRQANGVRLFVKRDDLMGLGGGGNKLRKLEFLLGDARAKGCDTFITIGGIQSNHARLSAAACARTGFACELVLSRIVPREDLEYRRNGNVLLDELFGAKIHELAGTADALAFAKQRAVILEQDGHRVYVVGGGGSSPVGSLGYAVCAAEIAAFERREGESFRRVVLPNGGSGTHAGLVAGFAALGMNPARVRSFAVLRTEADTARITLDLARETLSQIGSDETIEAAAIDVCGSQMGNGYGMPTPAMADALRLLARTEGLLLDPVYSGKAFAGMLADVRGGFYGSGDAVLFLMTGGLPGLFAYRPAFDH